MSVSDQSLPSSVHRPPAPTVAHSVPPLASLALPLRIRSQLITEEMLLRLLRNYKTDSFAAIHRHLSSQGSHHECRQLNPALARNHRFWENRRRVLRTASPSLSAAGLIDFHALGWQHVGLPFRGNKPCPRGR